MTPEDAYNWLHFVQAALPTIVVICIIALGIIFAGMTAKGREALTNIALSFLYRAASDDPHQVLDKVDMTAIRIEDDHLSEAEQAIRARGVYNMAQSRMRLAEAKVQASKQTR